MGKSLEEYAAEHGQQEQPAAERAAMEAAAAGARDWAEWNDRTAEMKQIIQSELKGGESPEIILYTALQLIGHLTNDQAWTDAGQRQLESVYADLAQHSFLVDNAIIADQRLQEKTAAYTEKARRQLQRQIAGCQSLLKDLSGAITALDAVSQANQAHGEEPAQ